jgi:predicted nucleotidyltransferase/uncharacterized protein (UPF0332 family)
MVDKKEAKVRKLPLEKRKLTTEKDIAMDFAIQAQKKFGSMIKASILFGSQARNDAGTNSDIDVIVIIDDASISWDLELISWYREELGKLVASSEYGRELHINTMKLTTWWQDLLHGDPVVINIVRYGETLIDSGGFFNPIKSLLIQGKIKSTAEAVYAALQRAPTHLARSKMSVLSAIEGVYWTMVDSAQAALITAGKLPPSPEHVPGFLKEAFVDTNMLKADYPKMLRDIYLLHKAIAHGEIVHIKGQEIDKWQDLAEKFLNEMTRIINQILENSKV